MAAALLGLSLAGAGAAAAEQSPGPPQAGGCNAATGAFLAGDLHGALAGTLHWAGPGLECAGSLRPGADGVRLQFAGPLPGGGRAILILGIDSPAGDPAPGEWPLNLTIIEEGTGRFYATRGPGRCWVRLTGVSPLPGAGFTLTGSFWCAGALPSLTDRSAVTPGEIRFTGQVQPPPEPDA